VVVVVVVEEEDFKIPPKHPFFKKVLKTPPPLPPLPPYLEYIIIKKYKSL
jgi:hypothetical protein